MKMCKACDEYAALLDAYIDGECTEPERIREHLRDCPDCAAYVRDAMAIRAAFPKWEDTAVPDGFSKTVMAAVRTAPQTRRTSKAVWVRTLASLAACCAVLVLVRTAMPVNTGGSGGAEQTTVLDRADTKPTTPSTAPETADTSSGQPEAQSTAEPSGGDSSQSLSAYYATGPERRNDDVDEVPADYENETPTEARKDTSEPLDPSEGLGMNQERGRQNTDADSPESAAPTAGEPADNTAAGAPTEDAQYFAHLTLTAGEAGDLLASYTPSFTRDGGEAVVYLLTREEFDALIGQLPLDTPPVVSEEGTLAKITVLSPAAQD